MEDNIFKVAENFQEITEAWNLVYDRYVHSGLIDPNTQRIHTVPEAIHPKTAVIIEKRNNRIVSTMSLYEDQPEGLPLDKIYKKQLDRACPKT
jgi:hypothetical protein